MSWKTPGRGSKKEEREKRREKLRVTGHRVCGRKDGIYIYTQTWTERESSVWKKVWKKKKECECKFTKAEKRRMRDTEVLGEKQRYKWIKEKKQNKRWQKSQDDERNMHKWKRERGLRLKENVKEWESVNEEREWINKRKMWKVDNERARERVKRSKTIIEGKWNRELKRGYKKW